MKVKALKDFQCGPKTMGFFPARMGDVLDVIAFDYRYVSVRTKKGSAYINSPWQENGNNNWEVVKF